MNQNNPQNNHPNPLPHPYPEEEISTNFYSNTKKSDKDTYTEKPKRKSRVSLTVGIICFILLFSIVATATFYASKTFLGQFITFEFDGGVGTEFIVVNPENDEAEVTDEPLLESGITLNRASSVVSSDIADIVEEVMPSVVSITILSIQQVQDFFGRVSEFESEGAGSGIIIAETETDLLVVTNHHVVSGYEELTISFIDGSSATARVNGSNYEYDLAVVSVVKADLSPETLESIAIARLGDSDLLRVGEPAIAIGNALGFGQSVTSGVISALDRPSNFWSEEDYVGSRLIQTDAAINPGNSGGALVNAHGEVIGINSQKIAGQAIEGVGYAIPISDVIDIITDLMHQEVRPRFSEEERGFLGITGDTVSADAALRYNIPPGVFIIEVAEGGGANLAGITRSSIITGINDVPISDMNSLLNELQFHRAGDSVIVTLQVPQADGNYQEEIVEVILGARMSLN